jgi:hypothetical protein
MEGLSWEVLINGAVVLFLWGLVWRSNHQNIERLERVAGQSVDREYCRLQHRELRDDLRDIQAGQKQMMDTLREIEKRMARHNGEEKALKYRD